MRYLLIHFFVIALVAVACNKDKESKSESHQIKGSGSFLYLDTNGPINPKTKYITYYEKDSDAWLFYGNNNVNELIIYELPSGKIWKRLKFEYRGPNGIGWYKGAHVHNLDSIFIISGTYYDTFFLVDTSGTVKRRFTLEPLSSEEGPLPTLEIYCHIHQENVLKDHYINLSTRVMGYVENSELHTRPISVLFDIKEGKTHKYMWFPKFDASKAARLEGYSRTFNGKNFIYSFRRLEDLYVQDSEGEYRQYSCKSKFQNQNIDWVNNDQAPIDQQMEMGVANPRYASIIYDKYRKYTYRFYKPGYKVKEGESIADQSLYPELCVLMVLDEDLKILGETLLPESTYDPYMAFVAKEGLYLALHPKNPKYNPDSLAFEKMIVLDN